MSDDYITLEDGSRIPLYKNQRKKSYFSKIDRAKYSNVVKLEDGTLLGFNKETGATEFIDDNNQKSNE